MQSALCSAAQLVGDATASEATWWCRNVLWAPQANSAVPQEDLGGLHRGLPHHCGGLLVPGWLPFQVQVDDLPPHGTGSSSLPCCILWWLCPLGVCLGLTSCVEDCKASSGHSAHMLLLLAPAECWVFFKYAARSSTRTDRFKETRLVLHLYSLSRAEMCHSLLPCLPALLSTPGAMLTGPVSRVAAVSAH